MLRVIYAAIALLLALFLPNTYSILVLSLLLILSLPLQYLTSGQACRQGPAAVIVVSCLISFPIIVFISIFVNLRLFVYQDYVDVLKYIAYFYLFILFYQASMGGCVKVWHSLILYSIRLYLVGCFLSSLSILNLLPFSHLYLYYQGESHLEANNYLMLVSTFPRLTGLSSGPSEFAISIVLAVLSLLLVSSNSSRFYLVDKVLSTVAFAMFLGSQSRTSISALFLGIVFAIVFISSNSRNSYGKLLLIAISLPLLAALSYLFVGLLASSGLTFFQTFVDFDFLGSSSLQARTTNWSLLFGHMSTSDIFFGLGPAQDLLAQAKVNVDSEYINFYFKYGVIGLCSLIYLISLPVMIVVRHYFLGLREFRYGIFLSLFLVVVSFTAVFLSQERIAVLFFLALSLLISSIDARSLSRESFV